MLIIREESSNSGKKKKKKNYCNCEAGKNLGRCVGSPGYMDIFACIQPFIDWVRIQDHPVSIQGRFKSRDLNVETSNPAY